MKQSLYTLIFCLSFNISLSQDLLEAGFSYGTGVQEMRNGINSSRGFILNYYFNVPYGDYYSPLYLGISFGIHDYGSSEKQEVPFYSHGYDHSIANITNTHNFHHIGLNVRYQFYTTGHFLFPFFEVGGGLATHYSNWKASDPFENYEDESSLNYNKKGRILTSRTFFTTVGLGINFKILPDLGISFSAHFQNGGRVNFRNTAFSDDQFSYRSELFPNQLTHPDQIVEEDGNYIIESFQKVEEYNSKHRMVLLNARITLIF
ncbi:MAG: hypothetical protein ACK4ND_16325 [Cytophagaceae bacterium]